MPAAPPCGEPIGLAHQAVLTPLLAACRQRGAATPEATLSDATFANLYLFQTAHDWRYHPGAWPHITGLAYDGTPLLLPLAPLDAAPPALWAQCQADGRAIAPLSDAQAAALSPAQFALHSARDDADYLYTAEQFRHYRGTLLQKKRNLVKQLLAAHTVDMQPYAVAQADEAAQVLSGWLHDKAKPAGAADDRPCREALARADTLGLHGLIFRITGRAAGFVLAEPLAEGVVAVRFAKALDAYKGLYQHMFQQYALAHSALGWLNFEQDLGLANFRQTKQSYQPVALLAKHRAMPLAGASGPGLRPTASPAR